MLSTLALVIAPILAIASLFLMARKRRQGEADAILRSTVERSAEGLPEFNGAQAVVIAKHYVQAGADPEGNDIHVRASFLCRMPGNSFFQVAIEGAHARQSATTKVTRLSENEAEYLLARHPYSGRNAGDA